ncbi:reprolysin-like metallopeptidase [Chryseobacterium carnipullorum]|uniref:reprolysin-like metallopeptidase n=1 Tax=Chryseobacterium carnipullorum TaxID=1124835 RepID=UPI000E922828|nr:zinc-dependent metalloprotease family protein [Chryseobacterium carnipullorum]HBV14844.1 propanediol utilization protein [Chryseobacterium carnipullorum]
MKKRIILVCALASSFIGLQAQNWEPVSQKVAPIRKEVNVLYAYKVDLNALRSLLKDAPEAGQGSSPVVISLPTTNGKVERFYVYSSPVVEKSMADRYELGAYSGVGVDNPHKQIRFSTAPNDFQSMIFDAVTGKYEFIEPINKEKDVYGVFLKSNKPQGGNPFECSTFEPEQSKKEMSKLLQSKNVLNSGNTHKSNDQKYRTYRLAISVNAEYTQLAGGVAGAAVRINATMARVNGVFEKDFGIHMNVLDLPQLIFTDPATDPYSNVIQNTNGSYSAPGAWNLQVQQTITAAIGNAGYDIGHFFGHRGGGGSAGRVGNVCINPASNNDATSKGAGITSPLIVDQPFGDTYDIDFVAHEIGHQFGGAHTMSLALHGAHMEPGSGSTIMGYAGITNANVQMNSDAYFHTKNIEEVQAYVNSKECGTITTITNNTPPTIQPLANKAVPKGTAFALTASAADAQNDPMTYTWEQYDLATTTFGPVSATRKNGANFRSLMPTVSPTRYFPLLTTVLNGSVSNVAGWETVSTVPRGMRFKVTVRDNNPDITKQQTQSERINLEIGNDGPFKVTSTTVYNTTAGAITWDVVNTNNSTYNVQNVKIDYTTDNGATWTVVTPSTPNDGAEPFTFSSLATGSTVKIRVSAIDNVFYAIGSATVSASAGACSIAEPTGIAVSGITMSSANINWAALQGGQYTLRYRKAGATAWTSATLNANSSFVSGLENSTQYEYQIANICGSTTGTFSPVSNFTTLGYTLCTNNTANPADEFISNVTVTPSGGTAMSNTSAGSAYTSYAADPAKLITLTQGASGNTLSITKGWTAGTYNEGVTAWIDFNRDGNFSDSEIVYTSAPSAITPVSGTFSVPANAYSGTSNTTMRVVLSYEDQPTSGCSNFQYGEIEDYAVKILPQALGTSDVVKDNDGVQIYPNPAYDVLNVTNISSKAQFSIFNMAGQAVMNGAVVNQKIPVSKLTPGVFVITIEDKGNVSKLKFIKK